MEGLPYRFGPGIRPGEIQLRAEAEAACFGFTQSDQPNPFYGPEVDLRNEPQADREAREEVAKAICETCRLRWPCLEWAIATEEEWGIWGAMAPQDRKKFRKWLRKTKRNEHPKGSSLRNLVTLWLKVEERNRKRREKESKAPQPVARVVAIKPTMRNGSGSVPDRNRVGSKSRAEGPSVAASGNGAGARRAIPRAASVRQVPRGQRSSNRVVR